MEDNKSNKEEIEELKNIIIENGKRIEELNENKSDDVQEEIDRLTEENKNLVEKVNGIILKNTQESINKYKEESLYIDYENINYQGIKSFDFIIIKGNNLEGMNMENPGFLTQIINGGYIDIVNTSTENFMQAIHDGLRMKDFEEQDMAIINHLIYEEYEYMYEIMFLQVLSDKINLLENNNDLGNIINIYDENVYGNMIITKTYVDPESNKMNFTNITKSDLYNMLNSRVKQKCIVYEDGEFREDIITGDLFNDNKRIFGDEHISHIEIPFFNHNLNIAYIKDEYGEKVFPNLIKSNIEIAVIYTKINDRYRGDLTMAEFNKIKAIMDRTDNYTTKKEWMEEEKDEYDRVIHKNKYRILHKAYSEI